MPNSHSLERVAEMLGVTKRTVYNRINSGLLKTIHVRGSQRVTDESFRRELHCDRLKRRQGKNPAA